MKTKTKRKDNYKNRNKPGLQSWPERIRERSIDGTFAGLRDVKERLHPTIGSICSRCLTVKGYDGKCGNRTKLAGVPRFLEKTLVKRNRWLKNYTDYFCVIGSEVYK